MSPESDYSEQLPSLLDCPATFLWPEPKDISTRDSIIVRLFRLAQRQWTSRSQFSRRELTQKCLQRLYAASKKLPDHVQQTINAMFPGRLKIEILPFIASMEGNRVDGQVIAGIRYPVGQEPAILALSIYLLFSPEEVFSQIVVHELAHCYLRSTGRVFETGEPTEGSGLGRIYFTRSTTEELAVDRLVEEWGFGRRNLFFNAWVEAVCITSELDCLKEYRRQLKLLWAQSPENTPSIQMR